MVVLTVVDERSGTEYTLHLEEVETVGEVKLIVTQQTGIPYHRLILFYKGMLLRDDDENIWHLGTQDSLVIEVYKKFNSQLIGIDVVWEGRSHVYELSSDDTVMSVKEMFGKEVGVPVHRQRLIAFGKVMEDDDKLEEFAIEWSNVNQVYLIVL